MREQGKIRTLNLVQRSFVSMVRARPVASKVQNTRNPFMIDDHNSSYFLTSFSFPVQIKLKNRENEFREREREREIERERGRVTTFKTRETHSEFVDVGEIITGNEPFDFFRPIYTLRLKYIQESVFRRKRERREREIKHDPMTQ